jgi:hypothetical protein
MDWTWTTNSTQMTTTRPRIQEKSEEVRRNALGGKTCGFKEILRKRKLLVMNYSTVR